MNNTSISVIYGAFVEEEVEFTLPELSRACRADIGLLTILVEEGLLTPRGDKEQHWRFKGATLGRARAAVRLTRDFEMSPHSTALVLDLLDEIEALRSRLRRLGA